MLSTTYGIGAQYEQSHDPVCPSEGESGNLGDSESGTFMVSDVLRLAWRYYISTRIPQLKLLSLPPHLLTQICISKPVNMARF